MDAPRRWQVGSLATAVTGLGIGAMLLGRPTVEPVEAIVLDEVYGSLDEIRGSFGWPNSLVVPDEEGSVGPEIVTAEVLGATPATTASDDSPDDRSDDRSDDRPTDSASGADAARSAPAPATSDPEDSVDSPSSADSD